MLDRTSSPKLTAATRRTSVYRYYAGFSEKFVESILNEIDISEKERVLDPWNGSGTTTAVCSRQGIASIGIDINPAMKPIAAVRSMTVENVQKVCDSALRALDVVPPLATAVSPFFFCKSVFEKAKTTCLPELHDGLRFGFMAACKATARSIRSKNPTWHARRALTSLQVPADIMHAEILASFTSLRDRNQLRSLAVLEHRRPPILLTADWNKLRWRRNIAHVITSPPYLTRIDYVMKTLPELLFLNEERAVDIDVLRGDMLGSVLTTVPLQKSLQPRSSKAREILARIRAHESKASSTYYYRFFDRYLRRIEASLNRLVIPDFAPKTITMVSQGSYYKEIFVDLPAIIDDVLTADGYRLASVQTFSSSNHMAMVNSRSTASTLPAPPEIAAIYRRKQ